MPVPALLAGVLDWIKARSLRDQELVSLSAQDLDMLASDIGITEADLRDIAPRMSDHNGLMEEMMRARDLDPDVVRRAFRGVNRDMEVTCARCRDSARCKRELNAGTAAEHSHEFCGNAWVMDEMQPGQA